MDTLKDVLLLMIFAMACAALASALKSNKARILAQISALIQDAEKAVQGSKMGPERKRRVIAQLETTGVRVTAWMSKVIDNIVTELNEKRAWLTENAKDTLSETVEQASER